ncbi:roadblock/LC7 domain-containing protein [Nonomuraea jabiensis]|uniref:roadblock/LC7 domain-containing protein n=1 Tax=Nonomuraea jabiensis TaxID=882448 RepID=UPI003D74AF2E
MLRIDVMISELAGAVPGVLLAAVVSSSGVPLATSSWDLAPDSAENLAASGRNLLSVAWYATTRFDAGPPLFGIVEMEHATLVTAPITNDTCLAVLATPECVMGDLADHVAHTANRAREVLTPEVQAELHTR